MALDELPDGVDNGDLVMHVLDEQGREVSQQVTLFGAAGAQLDDELADLEAYASAYDRALDRPELDPAARALLEEWAASRAQWRQWRLSLPRSRVAGAVWLRRRR